MQPTHKRGIRVQYIDTIDTGIIIYRQPTTTTHARVLDNYFLKSPATLLFEGNYFRIIAEPQCSKGTTPQCLYHWYLPADA